MTTSGTIIVGAIGKELGCEVIGGVLISELMVSVANLRRAAVNSRSILHESVTSVEMALSCSISIADNEGAVKNSSDNPIMVTKRNGVIGTL